MIELLARIAQKMQRDALRWGMETYEDCRAHGWSKEESATEANNVRNTILAEWAEVMAGPGIKYVNIQ